MLTRLLFCLIFSVIIGYKPIAAQEQTDSPFIFQISASACLNEPLTRTQTGFLVKGLPGIVTTLHGVVDCAEIRARLGASGATVIEHLYIDRIDIERDIALLSSLGDEDLLLTNTGLAIADHNEIDLENAYTVGHPYDAYDQLQMDISHISTMQAQLLSTVVPSSMLAVLSERGSPLTTIEVFDLGESLALGYMGAPIFNNKGQVTGMVNGGLKGDPPGNTWMIPWHDIVWKPVMQEMENLSMLQKKSPIELFLFSTTIAQSNTGGDDDGMSTSSAAEATPPTTVPVVPATPTPLPLPSVEEMRSSYTAMKALIEKLKHAEAPPANFQLPPPTDWQIRLIPLEERLYYIQSLLFPDWTIGDADAPITLYVTYSYDRGEPLGKGFIVTRADTQEVSVNIKLLAEDDGRMLLIEEQEAVGGAGSEDYRDMVKRAVSPLTSLDTKGWLLEEALESIVGHATALAMDRSIKLAWRMEMLKWDLASPHWADRKQAIEELGYIGPEAKEVVPLLIEVLRQDERQEVRSAIARALEAFGPLTTDIVPVLIQLLVNEKDEETRIIAVKGLSGLWQEPGVVDAHIQALGDESEQVRMAVAKAFGENMPDAQVAIPTLIDTLRQSQQNRRQGAARALGYIGPEEGVVAALVDAFQKDISGFVREDIVRALSDIGDPEVIPLFVASLREDESENVRVAAVYALKETIEKENVAEETGALIINDALPGLMQALAEDESTSVRRAAVEALRATGSEDQRIVPALIDALRNDQYEYVRWDSVWALGAMGAKNQAATSALIETLQNDASAVVRKATVQTLRDIDADPIVAIPALIEVLGDPDEGVIQAAADTLQQLTDQEFGQDRAKWEAWWQQQN